MLYEVCVKYAILIKGVPPTLITMLILNKRPTGLNGHLSIRDFTLYSCQKGAYLHLSSIIIINKNQQLYRIAASQCNQCEVY